MFWQSAPEVPEDNDMVGAATAQADRAQPTNATIVDLATGVLLGAHRDTLVLQEIERLYGPDTLDVLTEKHDAPTHASCDEGQRIACSGDS